MDEQAKISYETIGSDSYLIVSYSMDRVVNYQVQMLSSNDIAYLLAVSKRQKDEEVRLYYKITSRVTLSQILARRKLTRSEFLSLIDRMGKAVLEVREYQLPGCGLVFDPDYIFVKSEPLEASFPYLPIYKREENADFLKNAVRDLIMHGMVETSSDNFIQIILNTVVDETFTAEKLVQCVAKLMGTAGASGGPVQPAARTDAGAPKPAGMPQQAMPNQQNALNQQPMLNQQNALNQQAAPGQQAMPKQQAAQNQQVGAAMRQAPPREPRVQNPASAPNAVKMPPKKGKEMAAKPEKQKKEKEKPEKSGGGTSKKQKFMLVQAVVMVILAACASFNVFMDVDGNLLTKNILAIVILLAGTEVVAYREIFVNSKEKESKPKKAGKSQAKAVNRDVNIPGKKMTQTAGAPNAAARTNAGPTGSARVQTPYTGSAQLPNQSQAPVPSAPISYQEHSPVNSFETENTVLVDNHEMLVDPYLEYYDNGVLKRVMLNKRSVMVGRATSQVDFVVTSLKVGKIHAEFVCENGSFFVRDLNSKNGTYINECKERIQPNNLYPLQNGDRIALADCVFTLRCSQ